MAKSPPPPVEQTEQQKPASKTEGGGNNPLIVKEGERAFICGQTGSGKTTFACWELLHMQQSPIIIYDTKIEPKFDELGAVAVVEDFKGILEAIEKDEFDYIVVRPPSEVFSDPDALDDLLSMHYLHLHNHAAYIDEVATFHRNAIAGKGLLNLLQRGRSKGITLIMSTQRPARISRSCVSEAQKFFIFRLRDRRDRKVFDEVIEDYSKMKNPPPHYFYFDNDGGEEEKPKLYRPVKLPENIYTGYTDASAPKAGDKPEEAQVSTRDKRLQKAVWI